jgi:hypothetical protein
MNTDLPVLRAARPSGSDGMQHLSAACQRVFGLQEVGETVERLEPGVGKRYPVGTQPPSTWITWPLI